MPLPPAPIDAFRKWTADRWASTQSAVIDALGDAGWHIGAEDRINQLAQELPPPAPEPPSLPPPQPEPVNLPAPAPISEPTPQPGFLGTVGQTFSDLGSRAQGALQGTRDALGQANAAATGVLNRSADQAGAQAGDWVSQAQQQIEGLGSQAGSAIGDAFSDPDYAQNAAALEQQRQTFTDATQPLADLGPSPDYRAVGGATVDTLANLADRRLGGDYGRGALSSGVQRLRETGDDLGRQIDATRGSYEDVLSAQGSGAPPLAAAPAAAGLLGNASMAAMTALGAVPNALGGAAVGGLVGGERNLAEDAGLNRWLEDRGLSGIESSTPVLGGLANPAALGGLGAQAALPATVIDELAGMGLKAGLPVARAGLGKLGGALADALPEGLPATLRELPYRFGEAARAEYGDALGIVPANVARQLEGAARIPDDPGFLNAARNTRGVYVDPEGIELDLRRFQKADQGGLPVARGGVFYSPTQGAEGYRRPAWSFVGGPEEIEGTTLVKRPLIVPQANAAPITRAFDELTGTPGAFDAIRREVAAALPGDVPHSEEQIRQAVTDALTAHGGPLDAVEPIVGAAMRHKGVLERRWAAEMSVGETLAADAARRAGHDSIIAYDPDGFIGEVLDLREGAYPTPGGGYSLRPELQRAAGETSAGAAGDEQLRRLFPNIFGSTAAEPGSPFMARAAQTAGERAFDLGSGVAGGVAGAATAPEDATWQERAERAALGFAGGTLAGAHGRQLGRIGARALRGEAGELGGDVARIAAGNAPPPQTVGETLDRIAASQADAGKALTPPSSEIEQAISGVGSRIYGAWFDRGEPLRKVQGIIERELGRPLTESEDAYLHYRLLAGRGDAAAQGIKDELLPHIRGLSKDDESLLNQYLQAADNSDKAAAVGAQVEADALGRPLGRVAGEGELQSAQASLRGREQALARARQQTDDAEAALKQVEAEYRKAQQAAQRRDKGSRAKLPQLQAERNRTRVIRDSARRQLREAEANLETKDVRAGRAAERGQRAEQQVASNQAAAESAQMEGAATKGAEAAAGRQFSGGVVAQPIEDVRAELVQRVGQERADRIFKAAQGVWDYTSSLRTRLRDAGAISEETYQAWERDFPHYVRADILDYLPDVNGQGGRVSSGGPMLSIADLGIRRLSEAGTTKARDLPLNSVIRQGFSVEGVARRNEGAQALLKLRELSPELQRLLRPAEAGEGLLNNEAALSAFVNGEQQRFIGPKEVIEGLSRFNGEQTNKVWDAIGTIGLAPLLRTTATGANAVFIPKNLIRDAWDYMIRTGGASDFGQFRRSSGNLARAYWDSFTRGEADPDMADLLRAGGGQAHEFFNDSPAQVLGKLRRDRNLGGLVRPVTNAKDFMGAVGDVLTAPLAPVKAFGGAVERAPRLAQYRMARKEGLSPERAALAARDITMDFSRGGQFSKVINQVIPFFNVGLQGTERLFTRDFGKGNRLKTAAGITTSILLPSLAAEAWNRSQYPEDYANVPNYLKDTGIVVMLPTDPGTDAQGRPGQRPYLWLPMPQQYAFLKVLQDQAVAQAVGNNPRGWDDVAASIGTSFSPLGEDASVGLLPPLARTGAELSANYDFYRRRPIVPERTQGLPPEYQVTPNTSAVARGLGRVTGRLPGGVGPAKLDYAIRSVTGGVGQQVLSGTDALARAFGWDAPDAGRAQVIPVPGVGDVAGALLRNAGGQTEQNAYSALDREKARVMREQMELLQGSAGWEQADQRQREMLQARLASRIEAAYADRYRAINTGGASDVLASVQP